MNRKVVLPALAVAVSAFSLAAIFPVIAGDKNSTALFGDNKISSLNATTMNETSTAALIMDNGTLDCQAIAKELGGIGVPNGQVCDVVVVRQAPQITGDNGLNLNQFTLMNSVLEFLVMPSNATTVSSMNSTTSNPTHMMSSNTTTSGTGQVYVMGDFALLETEMNDVLTIVKENGWTVTGIHNHMINETPKTSFMHWEVTGDITQIIDQANQAFNATSIKG